MRGKKYFEKKIIIIFCLVKIRGEEKEKYNYITLLMVLCLVAWARVMVAMKIHGGGSGREEEEG